MKDYHGPGTTDRQELGILYPALSRVRELGIRRTYRSNRGPVGAAVLINRYRQENSALYPTPSGALGIMQRSRFVKDRPLANLCCVIDSGIDQGVLAESPAARCGRYPESANWDCHATTCAPDG